MTGRYEMLVEQNADVPMRDGAILRANVYRPDADARFPVLMTFGPYGRTQEPRVRHLSAAAKRWEPLSASEPKPRFARYRCEDQRGRDPC
jgi:predicted acyl esterase